GRAAPERVESGASATSGDVLPGQRTTADRLVYAFYLGEVEGAAGIPHQNGAGHLQCWCRLPAAGRNGARSGGDDLTTLEQRFAARVVLVLLKRLERLQARVLVVEPDDVADVHAVVVEVIEKAARVGVWVSGPAEAVLDAPGTHPSRWQLPQLLVAEGVGLRV